MTETFFVIDANVDDFLNISSKLQTFLCLRNKQHSLIHFCFVLYERDLVDSGTGQNRLDVIQREHSQ